MRTESLTRWVFGGQPFTRQGILASLQFCSAFLIGAYLIWLDYHLPWSVTALVGLYGAVLFVEIRRSVVVPTLYVNDSPYYLGFLFYLASMYAAFTGLPADLTIAPNQVPWLIRAIGSAILTSVAGMVLRSVLVMTNPLEERTEDLLVVLQDELRGNAARFTQAQLNLVQLVNDFTDAQRKITERQARVSTDYTAALERASNALLAVEEKITSTTEEKVRHLDGLTTAFAEASRKLTAVGRELRDGDVDSELLQCVSALRSLGTNLKSLDEHCLRTRDSFTKVREAADSSASKIHAAATGTVADLKAVDVLLEEFIEIARQRLKALARLGLER